MSDNAPTEQARLPITMRGSEYRIVYADAFSIRTTSVDFSITYATTNTMPIQNPSQPTQSIQVAAMLEQFTVTTALPVMKALAQHYQKIVEIIEEEIGPIRITAQSAFTEAHAEMVRQGIRTSRLLKE